MASDPAVAGRIRLTIDGPATIAQAAELRDRLAAAIGEASHIELDFRPTAVDVSSIQIVQAAWASLRHSGGQLRLAQPPSSLVLDTLARAGFGHHDEQDGPWSF